MGLDTGESCGRFMHGGLTRTHSGAHVVSFRALSAESASGKYRAVLRTGKDKKGEEKQYIEVGSPN